jgi:uridine kinase
VTTRQADHPPFIQLGAVSLTRDMAEAAGKSFVIGIAGGTGAGKTTIVTEIRSLYQQEGVSVLDQDSYYRDQSHRSQKERDSLNFDDPSAIDHDLLLLHLEGLRRGNSIEKPCYSFTTHTRTPDVQLIGPAAVVLIEGIFAFFDPRIRRLMDLKLFVDADADVRFIRRLSRDVSKRGRTTGSVIAQYLKSVRPMHNRHIQPTKQFADLVVDTTDSAGGDFMSAIKNAIAVTRAQQLRTQQPEVIPMPSETVAR